MKPQAQRSGSYSKAAITSATTCPFATVRSSAIFSPSTWKRRESDILDFRDLWVDRPQLAGLSTLPFRSPSFPQALSGNTVGFRTGPPTKAFGGDAFKSTEF